MDLCKSGLCKYGSCVNLGLCKFGSGVNVKSVNLGHHPGKWWRLRKEKIQEKVCKILVLLNTAMPAILRIHVATVAHPSTVHILYSKEIIGCTQLAIAELMFSC